MLCCQLFQLTHESCTYILDMNIKLIFVLSLLSFLVLSDKILVVLDNKNLEKTHSQFFSLLQQSSASNQVEFAYSFGKTPIELKYYDRFKYDHIVVLCTSEKESESRIKTREIISYFDEGGNVIVIGDVDTSHSYRKLFYAFGVDLDENGTQLKDHFSNHQSSSLIASSNYQTVAPFFSSNAKKPLLYKGIGLSLVNYENYQLYNLIKAEPTTFSKSYKTNEAVRAGTVISLAAGVQGLNNARALLFGSIHFFSDEVFSLSDYGNKQVVESLLEWVLHRKGVVRVKSMSYHGKGVQHKETLFNVGQKLYFSAEIEEYQADGESWKPYVATDLQVELVMLDPWVRTTLLKAQGNTYVAEFYAPQKEGIYQFKINYKKPGFNFIKQAERATIRPYKHDEFERFLFVAYPYFFGTFSTILATFIFIVLYLYSGSAKQKTQ